MKSLLLVALALGGCGLLTPPTPADDCAVAQELLQDCGATLPLLTDGPCIGLRVALAECVLDQIWSETQEVRDQCNLHRRYANVPGALWESLSDQFENRPMMEVNLLPSSCMRIENEYRNSRLEGTFVSRTGKADEFVEVLDSMHRADFQDSKGEQAVDVALAGGADDHDVVGAVPGGHSHAADVVFETARGDLRRDHAVRLRVDVVEVVRRGQRDAVLQTLRGLSVAELVQRLVCKYTA